LHLHTILRPWRHPKAAWGRQWRGKEGKGGGEKLGGNGSGGGRAKCGGRSGGGGGRGGVLRGGEVGGGAGAGAGQSMADSRVPIGRPLALALPTFFLASFSHTKKQYSSFFLKKIHKQFSYFSANKKIRFSTNKNNSNT